MNRIKMAGMIMLAMIATLPLLMSCSDDSDEKEVVIYTTQIELRVGDSKVVLGANTIETADGFVATTAMDIVKFSNGCGSGCGMSLIIILLIIGAIIYFFVVL